MALKPKARLDGNRIRLRKGEYQRKNGTYEFRWTTEDGVRHNIYAPTLELLREAEEQVTVDHHDGIRSDIKSITVNYMFDLWCQVKKGIKDSTFKNYIYMYETFVRATFGKKHLVDVRKSDVKRFYNRLVDDRGLKISTMENIHNVLYQVFQLAVDDDMIRGNPTLNAMKELRLSHTLDTEKRKALSIEQEALLLDFLKRRPQYRHWYPIFYIMLNTGMRVGEITGLRWCDIDLEEGEISVNHTLVYYNHRDERGCYFSINTPKTKAGERTIPMVKGVKEAFIMEREYQMEAGLESVSRVDGYSDFIFVNREGTHQNQGSLNKALRRIIRDCNDEVLQKHGIESNPVLLPHFSCHILRHPYVKPKTKKYEIFLESAGGTLSKLTDGLS